MVEKKKRTTVRSPTNSKSPCVLDVCLNLELLLMQLLLSELLAAFDLQYWDCVNKSQFVSLYLDHSS